MSMGSPISLADALAELHQARTKIAAMQAEIERLREALAAMILEHDAGQITLATMREARASLDRQGK